MLLFVNLIIILFCDQAVKMKDEWAWLALISTSVIFVVVFLAFTFVCLLSFMLQKCPGLPSVEAICPHLGFPQNMIYFFYFFWRCRVRLRVLALESWLSAIERGRQYPLLAPSVHCPQLV